MSTFAGRYGEMLFKHVGNRVIPATSATVTVYESDGSTEASLYTDRTKAAAADNPVSPDAAGNLVFLADPGTYVLSIVEDSSVVATNTVVVQPDPLEPTGDTDHGELDGLSDDDHTQYALADGSRGTFATSAQGALADSALQDATDVVGAFTGTPDGTLFLRDDGTLASPGGGAGATNLAWNAGTSTVTSDTGTDATITAVDATNPGLMSVADKSKLNGVESGATADQTGAEIKTAYEAEADTNAYTDGEKLKLAGIEANATADQTAAEILTAIKTVDGTGSGLDADLLDGSEASAFATSGHNHDSDYAQLDGEYAVNTVAASGATETLTLAPAHDVTMDANCTFTFPTPSAGHTFSVLLSGAFTPTFPASVDWDSATAPTYASPSKYVFETVDGGTTWVGTLVASGLG